MKPTPPATRLDALNALIDRAADLQTSDPAAAAVKLRTLAEALVDTLLGPSNGASLAPRIRLAAKVHGLSSGVEQTLNELRTQGNSGAHHGHEVRPEQVLVAQAHRLLADLASRFPLRFDLPEPPPVLKPNFMQLKRMVSDGDGYYLIRNERDTHVVRVERGSASLCWSASDRLLLGHGDQLWEWKEVSELQPALAISSLPDFDNEVADTWPVTWRPGSVGHLLNLRRGDLFPALPARGGYDECEFGEVWSETIRQLWGAAGPYALVHTTDHGYSGGAHNHWSCDFVVLDLRTGMPSEQWRTEVAAHFDKRGGVPSANQAWKADQEHSISFDPACEATALRLDVGPDRLKVAVQLTQLEWHFAGSDRGWSDETRSTLWTLDRGLPLLKPWVKTPEVVRHAFNFFPVTGWSWLSLDMKPHLEAQLSDGWMC